jgi:hypothetical protein
MKSTGERLGATITMNEIHVRMNRTLRLFLCGIGDESEPARAAGLAVAHDNALQVVVGKGHDRHRSEIGLD